MTATEKSTPPKAGQATRLVYVALSFDDRDYPPRLGRAVVAPKTALGAVTDEEFRSLMMADMTREKEKKLMAGKKADGDTINLTARKCVAGFFTAISILGLAFVLAAAPLAWALDPVNGELTFDQACAAAANCNHSMSGDATYKITVTHSGGTFVNAANQNTWSKIYLNGHTLTLDGDLTLSSTADYMIFQIIGGSTDSESYGRAGELIIPETSKFTYTYTAGTRALLMSLKKLSLFGEFTLNGYSASSAVGRLWIDTLALHPGASINMNNSFITSNTTWPTNTGATSSMIPFKTVEIFGRGGIAQNPDGTWNKANTVTYTACATLNCANNPGSTAHNSRTLYTDALHVYLQDGKYEEGTVLFHFDYDRAYNNSTSLHTSGFAPIGNPGQSQAAINVAPTIKLTFDASAVKTVQTPGSSFIIVDKLAVPATLITNANDTQWVDAYFAKLANDSNAEHLISAGPYFEIVLKTEIEAYEVDNLGTDASTIPKVRARRLIGTWGGTDTGNSRPLLSGMLSNAVALYSGADLLTGQAMAKARQLGGPRYRRYDEPPAAGEGPGLDWGLFTALAGYSQKWAAGNTDIDYQGFSFVGGPAANRDTPWGSLLLGAFLEAGRGSYETTDHFKTFNGHGYPLTSYGVESEGYTDYLGLGLFARHDFDPGYYAEASIRGGRVNNSFTSPGMGPDVKYEASSPYLGLHGGLGHRYEYKPGLLMDFYGKIFWTRIGGDSLTTKDGMEASFDDADFLRTRLGVRYTAPLLENLDLNFGGAWDYNFGDKYGYGAYKGTISTSKAPIAPGNEPNLKGSSGMLELGADYRPWGHPDLTLGLEGSAYLGKASGDGEALKVRGGSGALMLNYAFDAPERPWSSTPKARKAVSPPSAGEASGPAYSARGLLGPIMVAQAAVSQVGETLEEDGESAEVALETVTVYTDPRWKQVLSPGTVSVVIPDDYKGEQKSLGELLDIVPGLHVNKRGGSGQYTTVNVRGSTSAQVGVYVDGVPQNLGGDAAVDISLFTAENVARIEVYKGYIPARFTGAPIGGVINIVTKKPVDQSTTFSVGARSYGGRTANGLFTGPLLDGALLLSATRDQSDGDFKYKYWQAYNENTGTCDSNPGSPYCVRDRRRMNNSHEKTDVMAKWQNENISIQGSWKEMDRYYPWTTNPAGLAQFAHLVDIDDNPWGVNRRHHQLVIERDLLVGYRNDWSDLNWGLEFDLKKQAKSYEWKDGADWGSGSAIPNPGGLWSTYDTDRWGLTFDAAYKLGERNMLEFRGNYAREKMVMDGNEWGWKNLAGVTTYTVKTASQYEQKITNLQLQDTITMYDDLWLTLIGRANRVDADGLDFTRYSNVNNPDATGPYNPGFVTDEAKWNTTYGLAVKKNVTDDWTIKSTWGTFVRYPNFYEIFGDGVYIKSSIENVQTPVPRPEKGEQMDFTVEWNGALPGLETPGHLSTTFFHRRTENMIGLFVTPSWVYYGNYGTTRARGLELEAGLKSTYIDLGFSATWLDSLVLDIAKNQIGTYSQWFSEGSPILNSPEWETNLRGDFRLPWVDGLTLFAEHHYTGKVPIGYIDTQGGMRYEEELHTINLGLKAEIIDNLLLTAGVNDVFNAAPNQGYYDTDPGNTYVNPGDTSTLFFPKPGRVFYTTLQYTF